jgi:hypothetical protein
MHLLVGNLHPPRALGDGKDGRAQDIAMGYRSRELLDFAIGGLAVVVVIIFFAFSGELFGSDEAERPMESAQGSAAPSFQ